MLYMVEGNQLFLSSLVYSAQALLESFMEMLSHQINSIGD